ncbi:Na+/H+ antiporter subunit E [Cumulibacter soli]|uniref:Na+/H+ antiporter subunit E n=1 Tax=Cumulibacter soli TaxID=2546344 RepID=UPI001419DE8C|nr:Na+/H+ antiporter subunit E [Cumulibacter soli]
MSRVGLSRRPGFQPRTVIAVALVWILMWDKLSWGNVINGLLIGVLVTVVFPLPSIEYYGRPRPLRVFVLVVSFMWSIVVASLHVAAMALRPTPPPRGSIIEVKLRTRSDLYLTLVAVMTVLVPGSVVIEVRRSAGTLYVHDVDAVDETTLEQRRAAILDLERRLVLAIGTSEEIERVEGDAG